MNEKRPGYRYVCVQTHNFIYDHIISHLSQVPSFPVCEENLVESYLFLDDQPAVVTVVVKQDLAIGSSVVEEPATRFV